MKKTLTITFEIDDALQLDDDTGLECPTDVVAYAMDLVNEMASIALAGDNAFIDAKLGAEVLVDGKGFVSDEVKKRERQHRAFIKEVVRFLKTER